MDVLDALDRAGSRVWVGGGWGVDALVGRQTRDHRDLDLAVDATTVEAALGALQGLGYGIETDWRPVRVELVAAGRGRVDVHPVRFDEHGDGHQAGLEGAEFRYPREGFGRGTIGGRGVPCLDAAQQLRFHEGYPPRPVDLHDLALLHALPPDPAAALLGQRATAQARLAGLERDFHALVAAAEDSNGDDEHDPEGATVGFERAQLSALIERTRTDLDALDAALQRWDSGSYGRCEQCGRPIPAERLAVRPDATRCVTCASRRRR